MEFYLICGLFISILLATTACSRLDTARRDEIKYYMMVESKEGECRAFLDVDRDAGVDSIDQQVDSPVEIIEIITDRTDKGED